MRVAQSLHRRCELHRLHVADLDLMDFFGYLWIIFYFLYHPASAHASAHGRGRDPPGSPPRPAALLAGSESVRISP